MSASSDDRVHWWCLALAATYLQLLVPVTVAQEVSEEPASYQLRERAEKGDAEAQFRLGAMYEDGEGVPKDGTRAVEWLTKAAEQGHERAQSLLGLMYEHGKGVSKDYAKAVEWYAKAAEQGSAVAQCLLGIAYCDGKGVSKDAVRAVEWYAKSAEQGYADAQYRLAHMYAVGEGITENTTKAFEWCAKAAEQGYAVAQFKLGHMYYAGAGVPQDFAKAIEWYTKAAEQGDADAQFCLGAAHAKGEGAQKDYVKSAEWYTKAAQQGNANAQSVLGLAYAIGRGVPKDAIHAYVWLNLAAASGVEAATKFREQLTQNMTAEQIAEAQRRSAAFRPTPTLPRPEETGFGSIVRADATGSGFFASDDGYFVTNHHVIADARQIRVRTGAGTFAATIVRDDASNDLTILKVQGAFSSLHILGSRGLKPADRVATVGFPNPDLQGLAAKYSSGEIAALSGPGDDPRLLQISVPIQPGNSGGPLVDASGRVVGVVVAQLDKIATFKITGSLPENVNYAIKGTILLGVLEAVPGLSEKLKTASIVPAADAATVAKQVEAATGMVLVNH